MKITAYALTAAIAFAATAGVAQDISMGQNMLTGALFNELRAQGYETNHIDKLTLNEIAVINNLLNNDDMAAERDGQIKLITERASKR
jgi:hypothetical protein